MTQIIDTIELFNNVPVLKRRLVCKAMDAVAFEPGEVIVQMQLS